MLVHVEILACPSTSRTLFSGLRVYTHGKQVAPYYVRFLLTSQEGGRWAYSIPGPTRGAPFGSLGVGAVLASLSTDFVDPVPITPRKNTYILVVTDHFTKWVMIFAVTDRSAITTASVIFNEVIARYGAALSIHSDLGYNYGS